VKGLKRVTRLNDQQLDELILAQKGVLNGKMHINLMTKHLRSFCRVWAPRNRVAKSLKNVDPGRNTRITNFAKKSTRGETMREASASNSEATAAGSPFWEGESESVGSVDDDNHMPISEESEQQDDGIDFSSQPRYVHRQPTSASISPALPIPASGTQPAPVQSLSTDSVHQDDQVARLSTDNRSLRTANKRLTDENNYLLAEIARLRGNVHPFLHMSTQPNWIANGSMSDAI
jgi:hypothetical protein